MSKESILQAQNPGNYLAKKGIAGIDILITSRNGHTKIIQPIRIINGPAARMKKWNQFSQFR